MRTETARQPQQGAPSAFVAGIASLHLAAALLVFGVVAANGGPLDGGAHGASVFLALGTPAVLALLGLRERWPLVLAAALCSAVLAFVPFSLHSFVLGPLAVLYTVGYRSHPGRPRLAGWRTVGALVALPLLAVTVFVTPTLTGQPLCYTETSGGAISYSPPREDRTQSVSGDVVRGGCTERVPEAAGSLVRVAGFAAMIALAASARPGQQPARAPRRLP